TSSAGLITLPAPDITPDAALTALLGLSNKAFFLDADWDGGIDAREVGGVAYARAVSDRFSGHEFVGNSPALLPQWGSVLTPTGRRCLTFSGAQVLGTQSDALAASLDVSEPYTTFIVKKSGSSSTIR